MNHNHESSGLFLGSRHVFFLVGEFLQNHPALKGWWGQKLGQGVQAESCSCQLQVNSKLVVPVWKLPGQVWNCSPILTCRQSGNTLHVSREKPLWMSRRSTWRTTSPIGELDTGHDSWSKLNACCRFRRVVRCTDDENQKLSHLRICGPLCPSSFWNEPTIMHWQNFQIEEPAIFQWNLTKV